MYDANKNVIITTNLYNQLLQVASASQNIQVETQSLNHISFTHSVEKLGQQILLFTLLGVGHVQQVPEADLPGWARTQQLSGLVMVTFVGDEEYLTQLEIEGWLESAEQLAAYFVGLGDDFRPILAKAKKIEIGPNYTVLTWDEETLDVHVAQTLLLNHAETGDPVAAVAQVVEGAQAEVLEVVGPVIDKVEEVIDEVVENAGKTFKDAREGIASAQEALIDDVREEVETIMNRNRWRRILSSPVTKVAIGAAVVGAGVLIWRAARAKAESVVPALADVEL